MLSIATFLANIQGEVQVGASILAVIAALILIGRGMWQAQSGTVNVVGLIGGLLLIAVLWFAAFNIDTVLCWFVTSSGGTCPSP